VGLLAEAYRLAPAGRRGEAGELAANAPNRGEALTKLLRRVGPDDPAGAGAAAVVAVYRLVRAAEPGGAGAQAAGPVRPGKPADAAGPLRDGLAGLDDA